MAEQVQRILDDMVAPLQDLQQRGIFTAEEIRATVHRRRESEYALARRNPRKADFLRYLKAEEALEDLRKLRTERIKRLDKQKKKKGHEDAELELSSKVGDKHILQHLHLLFVRTLRKFKWDLALHLQYVDFCKRKESLQRLGKVYAEALALFPKETGLWIEAASHEFFFAQSIQTARVLLQRGIRMNPSAQDLWVQFFALELHFVQKLHGRQKVLKGIDDQPDSDGYEIAGIVYENARKAFPKDVAFRLTFLDQCRMFPHTEALQRQIMSSIEADCTDEPEAWIAQAMFLRNKKTSSDDEVQGFLKKSGDQHKESDSENSDDEEYKGPARKKQKADSSLRNPALQVIREATNKLRKKDMYLQSIRFLVSYKQEVDDVLQEECDDLIKVLFKEAAASDFYDCELAIEHSDYLAEYVDLDAAIDNLKSFRESKKMVTMAFWNKYVSLVAVESLQKAVDLLEGALTRTNVAEKDYVALLLLLFGAELQMEYPRPQLEEVFQRILLLAPGRIDVMVDDSSFLEIPIDNLHGACIQYLHHCVNVGDAEWIRNVYKQVLFGSSIAGDMVKFDPEAMKSFIDKAIEAESSAIQDVDSKVSIRQLYKKAIELYHGYPVVDEFRERRDEEVHFRQDAIRKQNFVNNKLEIPTFDWETQDDSTKAIIEAFDKFKVVHLKSGKFGSRNISWRDIGRIFESLSSQDKESWCVETSGGNDIEATEFLQPKISAIRAYCSFLIQKDKNALNETIQLLPVKSFHWNTWAHEPALWLFFGRNPVGNPPLDGRPDHTDSISNDGTWHFQLSGTKIWFLRPSHQLLQIWRDSGINFSEPPQSANIKVECEERDVIIVNTRLWFHRTIIPPQDIPSVSYARDFWVDTNGPIGKKASMSNVDGLYATDDIEPGTVIFTESDMPDCELAVSTDPNCEIVELEDSTRAIVSARTIAAGEFFCVAQSSDEESSAESSD